MTQTESNPDSYLSYPSQNPDVLNAGGCRVFVSAVSQNLESPTSLFPSLRSTLSQHLARADCDVKVQENFRQTDVDTILKLDGYIRKCSAVIQLVGSIPGEIADHNAVTQYLNAEQNFLSNYPELRRSIGDCFELTYTQWEAFIAGGDSWKRKELHLSPANRGVDD